MIEPGSSRPTAGTVRGVAEKFMFGFVFGVGFALAAISLILVADEFRGHFLEDPTQPKPASIWHKRFDSKMGVSVESHEARPSGHNLHVLGSVRNQGTDSWKLVTLEVYLLDPGGKLVRLCRGYVGGPVRPSQTRYFSVDCNGSAAEPVPQYKTYAVEVVDATYEPDDGA